MIDNPFHILGIPPYSDYDTVKQAFLRAAMKYHPDRQRLNGHNNNNNNDNNSIKSSSSNNNSNSNTKSNASPRKDTSTLEFVAVRQAFEAIVELHFTSEGSTPRSKIKQDEDLRQWFQQETGELLQFDMDEATRREVVRAYRTLSHGGRDKGGYWDMARQLAERDALRVKDGNSHEGGPILQLASSSSGSTGRRKRKR